MSYLLTLKHTTFCFLAHCGPAPRPAHSQVVHHNSSVVVHRCERGYDHRGGTNVSVCQDSGRWQEATLTCAGEQQVQFSSSRMVQNQLRRSHCVTVAQRRRPLLASWRCSTAGVSSGEQTGSRPSLEFTRFLSQSCGAPLAFPPSCTDSC